MLPAGPDNMIWFDHKVKLSFLLYDSYSTITCATVIYQWLMCHSCIFARLGIDCLVSSIKRMAPLPVS